MPTATPLLTRVSGDITQTAYELSEPVPYKCWTGETSQTRYVVVSHVRSENTDETAVFPGSREGDICRPRRAMTRQHWQRSV